MHECGPMLEERPVQHGSHLYPELPGEAPATDVELSSEG